MIFEDNHSNLHFKILFHLADLLLPPRMDRVAAHWKSDISSLTEESWSEVMESQLPSVISARKKLTVICTKSIIPLHVFIKWVGRMQRIVHSAMIQ